jgi:hypothetical protein
MTVDRRIFEYVGAELGEIKIGKELTPEDVISGKSGLSTEERKNIGKNLLNKKIFKEGETHKEAEEIISSLNN